MTSSMRQTSMVTTSSAHPNLLMEGSSPTLDALLEDLQNSVSRPGSSLGMNNHVNGPGSRVVHREVRVQQSASTNPTGVQYLQPANTTTVVAERAPSPASAERVTSYKTYQYSYRTDGSAYPGSGTTSTYRTEGPSYPGSGTTSTYRTEGPSYPASGTNTTYRTEGPSYPGGGTATITTYRDVPTYPSSTTTTTTKTYRTEGSSYPTDGGQKVTFTKGEDPNADRRINELDNLLVDLHHAQHSTPNADPQSRTAQQISRTVRSYQFDSTYGTPNSVRRELYPSSPKPERSTRAKSPPSPAPIIPRSPSPITGRPASPSRKVTTTVKTYTYEIPADKSPVLPTVVTNPTVKTYSYEIPGDKASPPPEDTIITYKYTSIPRNVPPPETTTVVRTYKYSSSGEPIEREPLIESPPPRAPAPPVNNTYVTYNYSSTNHPKQTPPPPHRPFPTITPTPPASAEPPKRLDELMANFTDVDMVDIEPHKPIKSTHSYKQTKIDHYPEMRNPPPPPPEPIIKSSVNERPRTKNIAGPPVYYPPGVELFSRKDDPVPAKLKDGANARDSSGKGSGGGVAAVPVCLPVCCAMPCVIM